jgi:[ribosomal protein S5]-alanine N-acetyltransferase
MQPFDTLTLDTPRLHLRPLAPADADALLRMHADPQVMRYWSTPPWAGIEQAHAMIETDRETLPAGRHLRLALTPRGGDDVLVGTVSLFNFHEASRRAEIGYVLAPEVWGRGLMHEALTALVGFAFGTLNLNRLEADIDPRNTASAKSLARLGFVQEGCLRERWIVGDEVSDTALFGLLRGAWNNARCDEVPALHRPKGQVVESTADLTINFRADQV